ncbi:MAG: hypothetical protein ACQESP_02660 [Candidatus Muiribacteriota bacterium]
MMEFEKFHSEVDKYWCKLDFRLKIKLDGIFVLDELKKQKNSLILGQYIVRRPFKPKIVIYYNSFMRLYRNKNNDFIISKIKEVINHELIHHLEYLNGTNKMAKQEKQRYQKNNLKEVLLIITVCFLIIIFAYIMV